MCVFTVLLYFVFLLFLGFSVFSFSTLILLVGSFDQITYTVLVETLNPPQSITQSLRQCIKSKLTVAVYTNCYTAELNTVAGQRLSTCCRHQMWSSDTVLFLIDLLASAISIFCLWTTSLELSSVQPPKIRSYCTAIPSSIINFFVSIIRMFSLQCHVICSDLS